MHFQVLYEDNHLIAVNKPANVLVHGDQTGDLTLADMVKSYIKDRYNKPGDVFLGVIHRLDRPVSGAIVFARTSKGLERMNRLFAERQVEKTYWAIVNQRPQPIEGELVHFILKDKSKNVAKAFDTQSRRATGAKRSELDYKLIGGVGSHYLLEIKPHTGRPHQIRVQLSKAGWPIRGDLKYGSSTPLSDGSIGLHCRSLAFEHPVKKIKVQIEADKPSGQIWNLFEGIE